MRNKRRHNTSFGYIGSGNKASVFNRKPREVFSEIKNKLNSESQKKHHLEFLNTNLSDLERRAIKNKIKDEARNKSVLVYLVTAIMFIIIMLGLIYLTENVF